MARFWMSLNDFYKSKEWKETKERIMWDRMTEQGEVIDEYTGKPIYNKYDMIFHHKIELTLENVNDTNISLNPDNIMIVSFKSHNEIHNRWGNCKKTVYVVHGSICSGKSSWVKEQAGRNDIIVDIDSIWQCISNNPRYIKPNTLKADVFSIYNTIIDNIAHRLGSWTNCYVITTKPYCMDRKRLVDKLGAISIHIDTPKETCLERLYKDESRQMVLKEYEQYINEYFDNFQSDEIV